jgi:uncharacterized protein YajQ (UPF0234 family)
VKLAEALPVLAEIRRRINEASSERHKAQVVTYMEGDPRPEPEADVVGLTGAIAEMYRDYAELADQIAKANTRLTIRWEFGGTTQYISIGHALQLAKDWRSEINLLENMLANTPRQPQKQQVRQTWLAAQNQPPQYQITAATFDVAKMKSYIDSLRRKANRLSQLVEEANWKVDIDFDASKYTAVE